MLWEIRKILKIESPSVVYSNTVDLAITKGQRTDKYVNQ